MKIIGHLCGLIGFAMQGFSVIGMPLILLDIIPWPWWTAFLIFPWLGLLGMIPLGISHTLLSRP